MKNKILISAMMMAMVSSSLAVKPPDFDCMVHVDGVDKSIGNNGMIKMRAPCEEPGRNMNDGMQGGDVFHASGTPVLGNRKDHGEKMKGMPMHSQDFDCMVHVDGMMGGDTPRPTGTGTMPTTSIDKMYMPVLKLGDGKRNGRQDMIKMLQVRLISEGFLSGTSTGYFGPMTFKALKKFQIKQGVQASGIVATSTMIKMRAPCEEPGKNPNIRDSMRQDGMMHASGTPVYGGRDDGKLSRPMMQGGNMQQ